MVSPEAPPHDPDLRIARRWNLVGALAILAVAGYILYQCRSWPLMTPLGPGPAFFPSIVAGLLALTSIVWFVRAWSVPHLAIAPVEQPDRGAAMRIAITAGATLVVGALMGLVGFVVALTLYQVTLLVLVTRTRPWLALVVAVPVSLLIRVVLNLAGIPTPTPSIGALAGLGL